MPTPLSPEQKAAMQAGRIEARKAREQALDVVQNNSQLLNVKFWTFLLKQNEALVENIVKSIEKAKKAKKQAKIEALKAELAELESDN